MTSTSISRKRANNRYFRKNRETILEKQREYRLEHKERILKRRREQYQQKKNKSKKW